MGLSLRLAHCWEPQLMLPRQVTQALKLQFPHLSREGDPCLRTTERSPRESVWRVPMCWLSHRRVPQLRTPSPCPAERDKPVRHTGPRQHHPRSPLLSGEQPRRAEGGGGQKMELPGQQGGGREEKGRPQERCGRNPRSQQLEGRSRQVGPTLGKQRRAGRRPGRLAGRLSSPETPGCPSGLRAKHCP